jgi:hypothetical protein
MLYWFNISSDDLKKNETLNIVLQQMHNQTLLLDKNLEKFNKTLSYESRYKAVFDILNQYNINIVELSKRDRNKDILNIIVITLLLTTIYAFYINGNFLYLDNKLKTIWYFIILSGTVVYSFWIIPKIIKVCSLDYYIFENLSKLI